MAVTILGPNGGELDTIKLLYANDACAAFYGGDVGVPPSSLVELCPGADGHVAVMWMWQFGTRTVVGGGLGEFHAGAAFSGGEAGGLRAAVRIAEPPMR